MKKVVAAAFLGALASPAFADEARCDLRLDQHVFNGEFSYWETGLRNVVVLFERLEPSLYQVKGAYELDVDGRYHLFRNYLGEWPTYDPAGVSSRVRRVRFGEYANGCTIHFIGAWSIDPAHEEVYRATYRPTDAGLAIEWPESSDVLRYSDVARELIDE